MKVVGIDTASRVGGVAIVDGDRFLGAQVFGVEEGHSEHLLPALEGLLERLDLGRNEVEGVAVSHGPGSFTGLRIGLAAAKALVYAWDVPLVGVSTLWATAWALRGVDAVVCAALDARRESVYRGWYDAALMATAQDGNDALIGGEARTAVTDVVRELHRLREEGRSVIVVGDGAPAIHQALDPETRAFVARVPMDAEPQRPACVAHLGAREMALGRRDDPFALVPNYLRESEAERRWRQNKL